MCLNDIPSENLIRANSAIVRTLGSWVATLGPSQRLLIKVHQCVLLLNAEPWLLLSHLTGYSGTGVAAVRLARSLIELEGLAHYQDVIASLEGVTVDGHRMQIRIGVLTNRLARGTAIKVPDRQV